MRDLTLASTDSVRLAAAILGGGSRGVVLLHQTDNGICGWFRYAGYLADRGFHVLLYDRRCTGNSSCPTSDAAATRHAADVRTAVQALHADGASVVAVVGASLGGAVAIGSCGLVKVAACVALSPALFDVPLGQGLTATTGMSQIHVPLLVAVAPGDPDSPLPQVQHLIRRARPGVVRFVRLPAGAGHGWNTVDDPTDSTRRSPFSAQLIAFLQHYLR